MGIVPGVNSTDDLFWELQDQVQRVDRMVAWLVKNAGGDPAEIGQIPGNPPGDAKAA